MMESRWVDDDGSTANKQAPFRVLEFGVDVLFVDFLSDGSLSTCTTLFPLNCDPRNTEVVKGDVRYGHGEDRPSTPYGLTTSI